MSASIQLTEEQGFNIVRLANSQIAVSVVPQLGAKISSLRLLPDGREWLFHPPTPDDAPRLFQCPSDNYGESSIVGIDECLPTIQKCRAEGRDLPGHGEVWNLPWTLDRAALEQGIIRTSMRLPVSPFTVIRSVSLREKKVILHYELINHSPNREPFLWALHPLIQIVEGDRLQVPDEVQNIRIEAASFPGTQKSQIWPWPSPNPEIDLSELRLENNRAAVKFFAGPFSDQSTASVAIENEHNSDRLEVQWSAAENPWFGFWLSRGAWSGYHHLAIEPTNAPNDSLATAIDSTIPGIWINGSETRKWEIRFILG